MLTGLHSFVEWLRGSAFPIKLAEVCSSVSKCSLLCCYSVSRLWSRMSFLKCFIVALALANIVMAGFHSCPSDDFLEERVSTLEMVVQSLSAVFSNDSNSTNRTQDLMGLYVQVSDTYGATVTTNGFVEFQEAIIEISAAVSDACSRPEDPTPQADDIPDFIAMFESRQWLETSAKHNSCLANCFACKTF